LRDVTQEREIQRQMQSQERLATVGQMAAGIAHDFNNIMASIVLYADMLLGALELSPQEQQQLETIRRQGHRAAHLVQQILDFSRRSVMERRPLDLVDLLAELEKLLRRTLPEHIQLHFRHAPGEYVVNADPTHIQQVVMNLALNARDAMFHGGELHFELGHFILGQGDTPPLHDMAPGQWVKLNVTDTGSGIPADVLPHIFEPFFTTKEVGQGTGLGLAQVYGIVGQHGGYIGVDSAIEQGTTFTIYLPALPKTALDTPAAQPGKSRVPGYGETILVVEDDTMMRSALTEILADLGYRVLSASNGQEALSLLRDEVVLVLSDLVMPKMGGVELYEHIKARSLHAKMVVITGYPLSDGGKALLEQGITDWIQKPFSSEKIAQVVHKVLRARY
jgi:nitrogen-specific signal transduction histidine kinase